jgi:hypothetical protein
MEGLGVTEIAQHAQGKIFEIRPLYSLTSATLNLSGARVSIWGYPFHFALEPPPPSVTVLTNRPPELVLRSDSSVITIRFDWLPVVETGHAIEAFLGGAAPPVLQPGS